MKKMVLMMIMTKWYSLLRGAFGNENECLFDKGDGQSYDTGK